jgi:hypothetical protein|tara:strand:- start:554 stop:739 length:186 start_codon:yes stop_codon:yes gene_type:complete
MTKGTNKTWKDVENLCRENNISPQDALTIVMREKTKKEIKELEHQLKEITRRISDDDEMDR